MTSVKSTLTTRIFQPEGEKVKPTEKNERERTTETDPEGHDTTFSDHFHP